MADVHQRAPEPGVLSLTRRRAGGAMVIEAMGEVDLATAPDLAAEVCEALEQRETSLCLVDLTKVTFLASAGLTALTQATRHAGRLGEPLRLVVDSNRPVIRPIELTGLDQIFALYHSVDDALAAGT
jgi:anti-sigma B factor antagonist